VHKKTATEGIYVNVKKLEQGQTDSPLAVRDQIRTLVDDGADLISIYWGAPALTNWTHRDIQAVYAEVARAKSMGTVIVVATGDAGSIDGQ
jgi:subtilisin family serine protease